MFGGCSALTMHQVSQYHKNAPDYAWNGSKTSQHSNENNPPKYCKYWAKGTCNFGADCVFWHGDPDAYRDMFGLDPGVGYEEETRAQDHHVHHHVHHPLVNHVVNLKKTKICIFWLDGKCGNGSRCDFAHGENELVSLPNTSSYHSQNSEYPNGVRPGDWHCAKCGNSCFASRIDCLRCGNPKTDGGSYGNKKHPASKVSKSSAPPPLHNYSGPPSVSPNPMAIDTRTPQGADNEAWRKVVKAMEGNDGPALRVALEVILKTHTSIEKASIAHWQKLPSSNAFAAAFSPTNVDDDDEEELEVQPYRRFLSKSILTACFNVICISLGSVGLLNVLLEFWSKPNHGCWTLLLSAGPVTGQTLPGNETETGHYCVLLHDLASSSHLSVPSIVEMVDMVVKTRPCSLLDHNQEGRIPLYSALKNKAPHTVAVSVAPLTHIQASSPLSASSKALQEKVLMEAMEKETEWDLPPKYLTDLILRDLMGQIEKIYAMEQQLSVESKYDQLFREQSEATRIIPDTSTARTSPPVPCPVPRPVQVSHLDDFFASLTDHKTAASSSPLATKPSGGSADVPFAIPLLPTDQYFQQPGAGGLLHNIPTPAPYNPFKR